MMKRPFRLDLSSLRDNLLVILVCLYLLFNYGFMQIRAPLGLPVGEVILIFSLFCINHNSVLPRFLKNAYALPLIIWWVLGIGHTLFNATEYGFWAFRDASHVIESLYLYIGFAFAGNLASLAKLAIWLPRTLLACTIYSLTFLFRDVLTPLSPTLPGAQGQPVPLFFKYTNTMLAMVSYAAYHLQKFYRSNAARYLAAAIVIITASLLIFPSRTLFMELMVLFIYFSVLLGVKRIRNVMIIIALPLLLLSLVMLSGIPINGRFGTEFELKDYLTVFLEIIPGQAVDSPFTSGVESRLFWWAEVLTQWSRSISSMIFGLGYGFPLISFYATDGVAVREPHNELLSILARSGVSGLVMFLWFQAIILVQSFRLCSFMKHHEQYGPFTVALLFILLCTLVYSLGEPPFTMPFFAIPYYFSAGVLLRMYRKRHEL